MNTLCLRVVCLWIALWSITAMIFGQSSGLGSTQLQREIIDLHSGDRWILVKNYANPAGPGHLFCSKFASLRDVEKLVIHTGDTLVISEDSSIVDMQLQAIALRSAMLGEIFPAQLVIGRKVILAEARGKGLAIVRPNSERVP